MLKRVKFPSQHKFSNSYIYLGNKTGRTCDFYASDCTRKVRNSLEDETSATFLSCGCLPDCNSVTYAVTFVDQNRNDFNETKYKIRQASFSVQFDGDEFIAYRRYERFGAVTFLSNIGGILGLFLGMSVLSIVEFFYFFSVRFINNLWHR